MRVRLQSGSKSSARTVVGVGHIVVYSDQGDPLMVISNINDGVIIYDAQNTKLEEVIANLGLDGESATSLVGSLPLKT